MVCASRKGVPCSTRCSARSVAAFTGLSAAAVIVSSTNVDGVHQAGERGQRERARVERVEQRLLVLLEIAVVRERQALERREQTR